MKWGVRRYQNADGSLTSAGRKRYGTGTRSIISTQERKPPIGAKEERDRNAEAFRERMKKKTTAHNNQIDSALRPGKDGKASKAEKAARSSGDIVNEVKKARDSKHSKKSTSTAHDEASKMSDAELNKRIDRMSREKRYRDLKYESDTITRGRSKTDEILETAGTVTAIAASTATIASVIYSIVRGK